MKDLAAVCLMCGDVIDAPTKDQQKIFGKPKCCNTDMVVIDRQHIHKIVKGIEKLKQNLEAEIVKGFYD